MKKLVIFGLGELAELADFFFTNDSPYEVVAFTVDGKYLDKDKFRGRPVVAFESLFASYPADEYSLFITIGYVRLNSIRRAKFDHAKQLGYKMASYISSKTHYWEGMDIGENSIIMEANIIQPFSKIGDNVIIWNNSVISHHVEIKNHCFIASGAVICGGVVIGEESFLGVNCTIREHVKIGDQNLIGAGALVLHDTLNGSAYLSKATERAEIPINRIWLML